MQLDIRKDATLGETIDAFHAEFPFLKIAFFSKAHKEHKSTSAKFLLTERRLKLGELPGYKADAAIAVHPQMRTWELEKAVEDQTGLHIQLFRKSGNTWLETSVSDDLTLEEQNEKARQQEDYHPPFVDPMDYREQD